MLLRRKRFILPMDGDAYLLALQLLVCRQKYSLSSRVVVAEYLLKLALALVRPLVVVGPDKFVEAAERSGQDEVMVLKLLVRSFVWTVAAVT